MQSVDIAIVGGGMSGLVAALALADTPLSIAIVDAKGPCAIPDGEFDLRVSALSLASKNTLHALGAWQLLDHSRVQAYEHMHVWDQDSFAHIDFSAKDVAQTELGYLVENQHVCAALWQALQSKNNVFTVADKINHIAFGQSESFISLASGTLSAKYMVGADGANSLVRKEAGMPIVFDDYEQQAIVATIRTELPHANTAWQVFTPFGPLAFLPMADEHLCSIVWSQTQQRANDLMALTDDEFNQALTVAFNSKLGLCQLASQRASFELTMRYAKSWLTERAVLVGDAAHTIHPLAGQGANLSIMDAAALAECIQNGLHNGANEVNKKMLRPYERWRKSEAQKMIAAMHGFNQLFLNDNPLKKMLRGAGVSMTNQLGVVKNNIVQHALGLAGDLPQLAKGNLVNSNLAKSHNE